jgi:hypothetical protein
MLNQLIRTHHRLSILFAAAVVAIAAALAGCGSSSNGSTSSTAASTTPPSTTPAVAAKSSCGSSTASAAGASEAASTATGDIPDNQQFLSFKDRSGGYSISYPEGWARSGSPNNVTFQDKGNTITIKVAPGPQPTPASVTSELKQEAAADPCLNPGTPTTTTTLGPNQVVKVTYTTQGQKSPVTGQRPKISVDRYVYAKGGKVATVDLATPVGVDNVDAYRMISESFRWS